MSKSAEQAADKLQAILSGISTKDLVDELAKRESVTHMGCPNIDHRVDIRVTDAEGKPKNEGICGFHGYGPARILVVIN